MCVDGLAKSLNELRDNNVPISPNVPHYKNDTVKICGILGNDVLSMFKVFSFTNVLQGRMLRISNGLVPIGPINELDLNLNYNVDRMYKSNLSSTNQYNLNVNNKFEILESMNNNENCMGSLVHSSRLCNLCDQPVPLHNGDLVIGKSCNLKQKKVGHKNKTKFANVKQKKVMNKKAKREPSLPKQTTKTVNIPHELTKAVNFVMHPKPNHFTPMHDIFPDSNVEQGIENLFSLESIGICDPSSSNYDEAHINDFKKSIELVNGNYYIDIPWHEDILKRVPSNFKLAKLVAQKVSHKNADLDQAYFDTFMEQKNLGIIEEIPPPKNPDNSKWIPHRPIIKADPLVNTKIRPVFNCSLKVKGLPSLNEAAYQGTDLLNNMFSLLNYFRTNDFVLTADIKKAFLDIRLRRDYDKNCFSFVVFHDNKFHYFRYNTIIFGFISSPFILNYILHHHSLSCIDPVVQNVIQSKLYVDNLIYTHNDEKFLKSVGQRVTVHLAEAGFSLREYCSNNVSVLGHFDNCASVSNSVKVLGYVYSPEKDKMYVKSCKYDTACTTKRQIVSAISSIYDPIGIINPTLVQAKLFLRKLCEEKYTWDEKLPSEVLDEWQNYASKFNLADLCNIAIDRSVACDVEPCSLIIFADASKSAYGFVSYVLQGNKSKLLFSKFKLAPMPSKTLPSLELLAIYLALQCTINIVTSNNFNLHVRDITILTDSQVALSWVLSGKVMKKNVFVCNRVKDLKTFQDKFSQMNIDISFSYVPTDHNIADILTKPISITKFCANVDTWLTGPNWINLPKKQWPHGRLGCLPAPFNECSTEVGDAESAPIILPVAELLDPTADPVIRVDNYSSYSKLFAVTSKVFEAISKMKKENASPSEIRLRTFEFLIKQMKKQCFPLDIEFLTKDNLASDNVPELVKNLNLFIDSKGILRSRGRISKNVN